MKRVMMWATLLAGLAGCGPSAQEMDRLAAQGRIDDSAPLQAQGEILIDAPAEKVWKLLSDINGWPAWQPDISSAAMAGPPEAGTAFLWHTGGMDIHSRIARLTPGTDLVWTGEVLFSRAIHVWTVTPLTDGRTLVRSKESMAGWVATHFYSAMKLQESDLRWLDSLKKAAMKST